MLIFSLNKLVTTKQCSQGTTIENLKSDTGWEFHVLLIKQTECTVLWENPGKINNEKRTSILLFLTDIPLAYADDHLYCLTSPKIHHIVNVTPLA